MSEEYPVLKDFDLLELISLRAEYLTGKYSPQVIEDDKDFIKAVEDEIDVKMQKLEEEYKERCLNQ